jgi:DUF971 family protein
MEKTASLRKEEAREGIVVWDQRGLVVVWPDGKSNRFSWDTLHQISVCQDCQAQGLGQNSAPYDYLPHYSSHSL